MGLVTTFLDKRRPPGSQLWVINSTVLSFKFKVRVNSHKKRVQISTTILLCDARLKNLTKRTMIGPQIPNRRADYDQGEDTLGIQPPTLQVQ